MTGSAKSTRRLRSWALIGAILALLGSPASALGAGPERLLPIVRVRLLAEGSTRVDPPPPVPRLRGRLTVELIFVLPGGGRSPFLPPPVLLRRTLP